jgi:ribosomal protein S6
MAKKDKEAVETTEVTDTDHAEARVYELGFHIDPEAGLEEAKKIHSALRDKMASSGTVVAEGEPQKIELAYTISRSEKDGRRDFNASYFAWIAYETDGEGHQAVTEMVASDSRIFRFIDLRTTKEEAQHSQEMHEVMLQAASAREEGGDEVSDTEIDAALKEVEA